MHYLIGRKEFVYYFSEFVMSEMKCIYVPDYVNRNEVVKLIDALKYEIITTGKLYIESDFVEMMTMQQFTEKYFAIKNSNKVIASAIKELDRYCEAIEEFYKNAQP